jgi:hypothetical protein
LLDDESCYLHLHVLIESNLAEFLHI